MATDEIPFERVATELRRRIRDGELSPGDRIPGERPLAKEFGVSTNTVGKALARLAEEGLVQTGHRQPTRVLMPPVVRARAWDYYRRPRPGENTSPSARDAEREGKTLDPRHETGQFQAPAEIAQRILIQAGERAMRTQYLFFADDRPLLASDSWEPYDLIGGTDIEWPEAPESRRPEVTGVIARFDLIGWRVFRVDERYSSRQPTAEERVDLDIPAGVTVTLIAREQYARNAAGDVRIVECGDLVIPADRYEVCIRHQVLDEAPGDS